MGFEQLAALKRQMAEEAAKARPPARRAPPRGHKASAAPAAPAAQPNTPAAAGAAGPAASAAVPAPKRVFGKPRAAAPGATAAKPAAPRKASDVAPVVLVIGRLQKQFPLTFPKNPAPKVPVKIGIHKDLIAQSQTLRLSEADLTEAIKTWCWGQRYWACLVENAVRVDLAGQPAGQVSAADAARARRLSTNHRNRTPRAGGKAATPSASLDTAQQTALEAAPETTHETAHETLQQEASQQTPPDAAPSALHGTTPDASVSAAASETPASPTAAPSADFQDNAGGPPPNAQ